MARHQEPWTTKGLNLQRTIDTYNMMFMLRWDPQLASSFQKIASQLKIYVGTSILIPAMSEIFLDSSNRRYWNLLEGAHMAGVQLSINNTILEELVGHFHKIKSRYHSMYKDVEDVYLDNEMNTLYVNEILIRAYLYSKARGQVKNFKSFIEEFVGYGLHQAKRDLRAFLEDEFHIVFEDTSPVEVNIDETDLNNLTEKLTEMKKSKERAQTDAKLMLMIYKMREVNNEGDGKSIFGYKTWWLSKDIFTYQAIQDVFGDRYSVNCYMRSDFLFNYISLSPKRREIDNMFKEIFPSLMGINLSYHMPKELCKHINSSLNEHKEKSHSRIKRAIRNYTEKLMTSNELKENKLTDYYDDVLEKELNR